MTRLKDIALKKVFSILRTIDKITPCPLLFKLAYRIILYYLYRIRDAEEVPILYNLAKSIKAKTIVELGVGAGASTRALLIACYELKAHLWSIDIAPCIEARRKIEDLSLSKYWTFTQQNDLEFVKTWNKPIDLLFIDTSHQYEHTKQELLQYSPFVAKGGRILLHDSLCKSLPGVAKAISYFLKKNPHYEHIEHNTRNGLAELINT